MSRAVALKQGFDVSRRIAEVRGQRVLLDADLAELYGVSTRRLNEAVRRHASRFPDEFMFRLTPEELGGLVSQARIPRATSRGGRTLR